MKSLLQILAAAAMVAVAASAHAAPIVSGYAASAIPEPGTLGLFGAGIAAVAVGWRRRAAA